MGQLNAVAIEEEAEQIGSGRAVFGGGGPDDRANMRRLVDRDDWKLGHILDIGHIKGWRLDCSLSLVL